jgi:hypothetical protein
VIRGSIASVVDVETGEPLDKSRYRTIDGLFDFLHEAIDRPAASIRSAFDPNLGYPSAAQVDYVAAIADEEMAFRVLAVSPLRRW